MKSTNNPINFPGGTLLVATLVVAGCASSRPPVVNPPPPEVGASGASTTAVTSTRARRTAPGYGPWSFGMSRQQVSAVRQHGPYTYVRVTGGLETRNGFWAQHKKHTSFVFKGDSLWRVQLWMYRGRDLDTALKQWVDLYRHMSATYGPVSFPEIKTTGDYDAELVERLFRSTLEPLATATRGQSATAVVKFHMTPKTSPTAKRVSAMLAYHSKFGYYVMFMHDQPRPVTRL